MSYPCPALSYNSEDTFFKEFIFSGMGEESKTIKDSLEEAEVHFFSPMSRQIESPWFKFHKLKNTWIEDTQFLSSINEICMHPAYQRIIGMGKIVIPFIIEDLLENHNHWFWALISITGVDPVPSEKRGKIKEMTMEWFKWWLDNKDNL